MQRALKNGRWKAGILFGLMLVSSSPALAEVQSARFSQTPPLPSRDRAATPPPKQQVAPKPPNKVLPAVATPAAVTAPPRDAPPVSPDSAAPVAPPVRTEPFAILQSQMPAAAPQLNMVRTAPEQLGQVPGHFFWIRQGLQAAQDPVDGDVVFMNDDGRVLGRAKLPAGFVINEIFPDTKDIRLIDAGRRQVTIPRTIDPAAAGTLQATAGSDTRSVRLMRRSNEELLFQDQRRAGSRVLTIRSLAGGMLAQAYEIGSGGGINRYLVTEEIIGVRPALTVRMFVQRFDSAGKLTGVVHVSLEGMDSVPRDFIAITDQGHVRVLVPQDSGIKIDEFEFAAPPNSRRLSEDEIKGLGRLLRTTPVDSNIRGDDKTLFQRDGGPTVEVIVRATPITRETIMRNARAFLTVNWEMLPDNYAKSGIDNVCEPQRGKFWQRPRIFSAATVGTKIGPMPYKWGGDDTPDSFRVRAKLGALAGDVCTCRSATYNYCLVPESIGVDCSGFVSRAWGIAKRGTSSILEVSDSIGDLGDLKPGDAFNWAGRHIRLLAATAAGATLAYTVIESSTRRDCQGVCERTYRPSELNGYQLIRYRGVTDTTVIGAKR